MHVQDYSNPAGGVMLHPTVQGPSGQHAELRPPMLIGRVGMMVHVFERCD